VLAIGILIDIPIVICTLSHNIYLDARFDYDLLLTLDAGNHPSQPSSTVKRYMADWWTKDDAVREHFTFENLSACLSFHQEVKAEILQSVMYQPSV
jgi:hypothetical protein